MGLFGSRKKDRVLDLTEKYRKQLDKGTDSTIDLTPQATNTNSGTSGLDFFAGMASAAQTAPNTQEIGSENYGTDEKKKRLAKRLIDMTSKIEDLSNQIYHLQQRIEVLERKSGMRV